jgi:glycosyltransferase involved in cell wall biosynthesis
VTAPAARIRVLHLLAERGHSGGEVQLAHLVRHLAARGHPQQLALVPDAAFARLADELRVPHATIDLRRPWRPSTPLRLRRLVREFRPDLVHFGCGRSLRFGGWFLLGAAAGVRVTTRRIDYPIGRGWRALRYRCLVDHVVANCDAVAARVLAAGVPAGRVTRIHEGIEIAPWQGLAAERQPARARLGLPAEAQVLACAATLRPRKGQRDLIRAFAGLAATCPQARLVLAGDGEDRAALLALVEQLGLRDRVHLPGAVRPVQGLYAAADLFCMPSHHEGLSNACLEASAAGLPLVVSDAGGLPEIVADGETGLVVPAGDVAGLRAALERMLQDPALRARAGAAGARRTAELFTAARMADNMEALFLRLCRPDA